MVDSSTDEKRHISPKTFRILEIEIPEQFVKVRLSLEEFHRLAEKLDFVPVLENSDTLIFLEAEGEIAYFTRKAEEKCSQTAE